MACGIGTPLKKRENQKLFAGFIAAVFLCYFVLLNYKYEQVRVANPCLSRTGVPWIIIDYIEFSWSVSINFNNNRL